MFCFSQISEEEEEEFGETETQMSFMTKSLASIC
jgi:hypothetical protein